MPEFRFRIALAILCAVFSAGSLRATETTVTPCAQYLMDAQGGLQESRRLWRTGTHLGVATHELIAWWIDNLRVWEKLPTPHQDRLREEMRSTLAPWNSPNAIAAALAQVRRAQDAIIGNMRKAADVAEATLRATAAANRVLKEIPVAAISGWAWVFSRDARRAYDVAGRQRFLAEQNAAAALADQEATEADVSTLGGMSARLSELELVLAALTGSMNRFDPSIGTSEDADAAFVALYTSALLSTATAQQPELQLVGWVTRTESIRVRRQGTFHPQGLVQPLANSFQYPNSSVELEDRLVAYLRHAGLATATIRSLLEFAWTRGGGDSSLDAALRATLALAGTVVPDALVEWLSRRCEFVFRAVQEDIDRLVNAGTARTERRRAYREWREQQEQIARVDGVLRGLQDLAPRLHPTPELPPAPGT